ncbi:27929_t:CDS:1, partial [Dentiscutata erythropus]
CFGLKITEDKPGSLYILSANINPKNCKAKTITFFLLSTQPMLKTCICEKYYANFISKFFKITSSQQKPAQTTFMEISSTILKIKFNRISKELSQLPVSKITLKILFLLNQIQTPKLLFILNIHTTI